MLATKSGFHFLCLLLTVLVGYTTAATYVDVELLIKNLTTRTDKKIRPNWNQSLQTVLYTSFSMISLQDIDEVEGTVSVSGFFSFTWHDFTLMWNPANYGGVSNIELPVSDVWRPVIVNGNAAKNLKDIPSDGFLARVDSTGWVSYYPGDTFAFTCDIDSSFFPFDTQTCTMDVVAWGYDQAQIRFDMNTNSVNMDLVATNGEWTYSGTKMESVIYGGMQIPGFKIDFTFKRRSTFFVSSLVLPVVFLGLLNILVFILPQDSGERVGFSITALLALVVFLTIAQTILPATATPNLAFLCIFLLQDIAISGFIVFSVIISSWLYHKADEKTIPRVLQRLVGFSIFNCCKRKKRNIINVSERNQIKMPISDLGNISDENDETNNITWKQVSERFDSISFWFYFIWFVEANVKFILDSNRAP